MESKLTKKYGLLTAISMVVGIVIGSGVFFKAGKVLNNTNGSMAKSVAVVGIVGLVMIICSYVFSVLANRYEKVNGIVDYAEASLGKGFGYFVAWFMTTMYYPILTSCLVWVSSQYACSLFGFAVAGPEHVTIGLIFMVGLYAMNALSPKLGGKFQVSTTVIKLIPLCLMAIVGIIAGLINGQTLEALGTTGQDIAAATGGSGMLGAIVAFAFSYEGWIIATSINSELHDSKKNLPKALLLGAIIVIVVYILYFVGLTGSLTVPEMIAAGDDLPGQAFTALFGSFVGSIIYVFIVISCLGTANGLMMGCVRGAYSIAARGQGIAPKVLSQVDPDTNSPTNSTIVGLLLCGLWFFYWQICFFEGGVLGALKIPAIIAWEPDELPIITLFGCYIPIFINMIIKEKSLNTFQRYVAPIAGIAACVFMLFCTYKAYGIQCLYYLIVFAVIMLIGVFFYKKKAAA